MPPEGGAAVAADEEADGLSAGTPMAAGPKGIGCSPGCCCCCSSCDADANPVIRGVLGVVPSAGPAAPEAEEAV